MFDHLTRVQVTYITTLIRLNINESITDTKLLGEVHKFYFLKDLLDKPNTTDQLLLL